MYKTADLKQMDAEEAKAYAYIQDQQPTWQDWFIERLETGRKGILQRLLQAVVRENIAGLGERATWSTGEGDVLRVQLSGGRTLLAPVLRKHSLGRFDLCGDVIVQAGGREEVLEHPVRLLDLIHEEGVIQGQEAEAIYARFREEIQNSVANYALALAAAEARKQPLAKEAQQLAVRTSIDYATKKMQADETFSPLAFFEQWVTEGHPLHPGAKIKMGLEYADVVRYAPEYEAVPELRVVAVKKSASQDSSFDGRSTMELLFETHDGLEAHVRAFFRAEGLTLDDYRLTVVHPWQFEHTMPVLFAPLLATGDLLPIPGYTIPAHALLSFRTLAPVGKRGVKHHVKTSVAIQTTGTMRTISPNSAHNGPLVAGILDEVQRNEQHFGGQFLIMPERVGVYVDPRDPAITAEQRALMNKNLVSILRDNVEGVLAPEEIAMPGSALLSDSPLTGHPIVAELIEQFMAVEGLLDRQAGAIAWMTRYAEAALPGFLIIMSRYGIALEGHLQNSVPVFANGRLTRMVLRDFGGCRMLRERLQKQGLMRDFLPGSITVVDDLAAVQNKVFYPVYQNHIGELITAIVRWCGIEEKRLWQPVADVSRAVYRALRADASIAEQAAADEAVLFASEIDLKAMTTMRLLGSFTSYSFAKVSNPLAGFVEEGANH